MMSSEFIPAGTVFCTITPLLVADYSVQLPSQWQKAQKSLKEMKLPQTSYQIIYAFYTAEEAVKAEVVQLASKTEQNKISPAYFELATAFFRFNLFLSLSKPELAFCLSILLEKTIPVNQGSAALYKELCELPHSCQSNVLAKINPDFTVELAALKDLSPNTQLTYCWIDWSIIKYGLVTRKSVNPDCACPLCMKETELESEIEQSVIQNIAKKLNIFASLIENSSDFDFIRKQELKLIGEIQEKFYANHFFILQIRLRASNRYANLLLKDTLVTETNKSGEYFMSNLCEICNHFKSFLEISLVLDSELLPYFSDPSLLKQLAKANIEKEVKGRFEECMVSLDQELLMIRGIPVTCFGPYKGAGGESVEEDKENEEVAIETCDEGKRIEGASNIEEELVQEKGESENEEVNDENICSENLPSESSLKTGEEKKPDKPVGLSKNLLFAAGLATTAVVVGGLIKKYVK
jgi:hypothetical protein